MSVINRRDFLKVAFVGTTASLFPGSAFAAKKVKRPNVLLICVDDLRPQTKAYGKDYMITPNLDKFMASARPFDNHFVHVPLCGPSRYTMLSGKRFPLNYSNATQGMWRDPQTKHEPPLPRWFRDHGYNTVGIGKISHHPGNDVHGMKEDLPDAWDHAYAPVGDWKTPWGAFFAYDQGRIRAYHPGKVNDCTMPPCEAADVPDTGYPDGLNAEEAIKQLENLKDEQFFLAVGFYKPHLPHNAPKKYWDLYDRDKLPPAPFERPPENSDPEHTLHNSPELTTHYGWPSGPGVVTEEEAKRTRHAYFACVSYIDAQIGKVLDALEEKGLADNTIVALWGDHGWHLNDLGVWGKMTLYDYALRSPLIIRTPGLKKPGVPAEGVVETCDLYATLTDVCGLDTPEHVQGTSLWPMLRNPKKSVKEAAISSFHNGTSRTIRTEHYRYSEYRDKAGKIKQTELFDVLRDPWQTRNIAKEHPEIVEPLQQALRK